MAPKDPIKETLEALHKALAEQLLARVKSGEATAADLGVARQFLKDNNIEALIEPGNPLHDLARAVPFKAPDEGDFRH